MGAVLLRRALLSDAHGSQRGEEHPYHQEATTGGDECRRVLRGFRARSELHQTDNQDYSSQQQRADDDVQRIYLRIIYYWRREETLFFLFKLHRIQAPLLSRG